MSDLPFGKLLKTLSSIEKQFNEIDTKLEKFEKTTKAYADKIQNTTEDFIENTGKKVEKIDDTLRRLSDKSKQK